MNILNDKTDLTSYQKPEQELVEQEKQEYKLLGTYLRTKGLKLFSFNPINNDVLEVEITVGNEIKTIFCGDYWVWYDPEFEKATVDTRKIYFECLNMKNALRRVRKYKDGRLKDLCNLKEPSKEGIKFY